MNITINPAQDASRVTVMGLVGDLDGSNFQELIAAGRRLAMAGTTCVLLDLSDLRYMSSAGIVAMVSIARAMQGDAAPGPEAGWAAFHEVEKVREQGKQQHVKLVNPQPHVRRVLELTGMN